GTKVTSAVLREPPLRDWYFTVRSAASVAASSPGASTRPISKLSLKPGLLVRALERSVLVSVAPVPPANAADAPPPSRMPLAELIVSELTKLAAPPVVVNVPPSVRKRRWPVAGSYSKSGLPSPLVPIVVADVVAEATSPVSEGLAAR